MILSGCDISAPRLGPHDDGNEQTEGTVSKLIFTIERTDEYSGEPFDEGDLSEHEYVVTLNNGDIHLLDTVAEIEELVSVELFLHGYSEEQEPSDE
jgi:hypothetical protein